MSKVGTTNLGKRIISLDVSPEFDGFSKVVINVTEDLSYEAGTNTGRILELTNPWGTQKMANDILVKIRGHQYQPLTAEGALLDPAAELGDGITVNGVYSGLYKQQLTFGPLFSASIEAPQDEEIDHEDPYEPSQNREITRQFANVKSQFTVQAAEIAARVTRNGGDNRSFGWSLTENGFILSSGNKTVFKATESGLEVTGRITATSGYIGNGSSGFEITSNSIRNGVLSMYDTDHYGVYVGTDGITLGKGVFKVDCYGNLTASSGTFNGTINAKSGTIAGFEITSNAIRNGVQSLYDEDNYGVYIGTDGISLGNGGFRVDRYGNLYANSGTFEGTVYAGSIDYGGDAGTFDGWGLTESSVTGGQWGAIGSGEITTTNVDWGIENSLANGDWAGDIFNGWDTAPYVQARTVNCDLLAIGGYDCWLNTIVINGVAHNVVTWGYLG